MPTQSPRFIKHIMAFIIISLKLLTTYSLLRYTYLYVHEPRSNAHGLQYSKHRQCC